MNDGFLSQLNGQLSEECMNQPSIHNDHRVYDLDWVKTYNLYTKANIMIYINVTCAPLFFSTERRTAVNKPYFYCTLNNIIVCSW